MDRVGFEPRMKAYLIDVLYLILFCVIVAFALWTTGWYGVALISAEELKEVEQSLEASGIDPVTMVNLFHCLTYSVIVSGFLYTLIEAFYGASLGKMHLGLIIGHEDGREGDLSLYLTRWAIKNLAMVVKFVMLITGIVALKFSSELLGWIMFGGCFMIFMNEKQALHDKVVRSAVYNVDREEVFL
jgi:uncharacterized RDD family membrane protein YckC